jgi:hypothetical protein
MSSACSRSVSDLCVLLQGCLSEACAPDVCTSVFCCLVRSLSELEISVMCHCYLDRGYVMYDRAMFVVMRHRRAFTLHRFSCACACVFYLLCVYVALSSVIFGSLSLVSGVSI